MALLILLTMILTMTLTLAGAVNLYLSRQYYKSWLGLTTGRLHNIRQLLDWLVNALSLPIRDIQKKLLAAGIYNRVVVKAYFPAKFALAALSALVIFAFGSSLGLIEVSNRLIATLLLSVGWIIIPDIWLEKRRKKLVARVSGSLPYLLELMAACVQTGMTIEASIDYLAQELHDFDRDIAYLMEITASKAKVSGTQKALHDLSKQLPSREMQSFVHTLQQSLRYGNALATALTTQASHLREANILTLEEKVAKLSAKLSIPLILFIMLPLVILMIAPGIMRLMSNASL